MWNGFYYVIVVIVAVWGIFTGYRRGFMRQMGGVLSVAFGIVATRLVSPDFITVVDGWFPPSFNGFNRPFVCSTIACGIIYIAVSSLIALLAWPVGRLLAVLGVGVLDSICGSVFRLFQVLILVSIFYNLIADFNPAGDLTRSSSRHDGNLVEGVLKIAPAVLGFPDAEEVAYRQQLEDAKKIS